MSTENLGRENVDSRLMALMDHAKEEPFVFMKDLRKGDVLEIDTRNSTYTMQVVDPKNGEVDAVSDGKYLRRETRCRVLGSSLTGTGTMIKMDGIAVGLQVVLSVPLVGELKLSTTKEVRVDGIKVLPPSKH